MASTRPPHPMRSQAAAMSLSISSSVFAPLGWRLKQIGVTVAHLRLGGRPSPVQVSGVSATGLPGRSSSSNSHTPNSPSTNRIERGSPVTPSQRMSPKPPLTSSDERNRGITMVSPNRRPSACSCPTSGRGTKAAWSRWLGLPSGEWPLNHSGTGAPRFVSDHDFMRQSRRARVSSKVVSNPNRCPPV